MTATVQWNDRALVLIVHDLSLDMVDKVALEIIAASDPPIDTGFLDASAYVNSATGLNTFDEIWQSGEYTDRGGESVQRTHVDGPEPAPKNGAVAGWAADYALPVEEATSFIYRAVQEVAGRR